jgi:hypothetical protein
MEQQNVGSKRVASIRVRARAPATEGVPGFAAQLQGVARSLRRDGATIAGFVARASEDISSLVKYAGSPGAPRLVREAERLARRRPAAFLGGALLLSLAILRILRNSPTPAADEVAKPSAPYPLDESRMPRHDGPSGYFSARGEGTITNTPQTRSI